MKRYLLKGVIVLCLAVLTLVVFTGCSEDDKTPKDDGEQAASEELIDTKVTGEITLIVEGFAPDYSLDDTSRTMAVVHEFQGRVFFLHKVNTGVDKLIKLEEGKSYVFVIEDKVIGKLTRRQFDGGCPSPDIAIRLFNLKFKEIREAKEDEIGTGAGNLRFEEI